MDFMKKNLQPIVIIALLFAPTLSIGQSFGITDETILVPVTTYQSTNPVPPSAAILSNFNIAPSECISNELKKEVMAENERNRILLRQSQPQLYEKSSSAPPTFIWPTPPKAASTDYGYYTVNFLVDHNFSYPNQLLDYNCAGRTYDWSGGNHEGTDIILWPYGWRKMDENIMEIVAAAPGIIINKRNNFFDRMCVNAGNPNWNGIILEHSDGSQTWYWHFQAGSATTKNIGDAVISGEYLGKAGSSGSSTYPHLHFQVMDSLGATIDPWQGSCNSMNSTGWWQNQQPYNVPSVNRICTKKTQVEWYNCPDPEITNEADTFALGDSLWMWLYTRDLETNSQMQLNIYNPSGSNVLNWQFVVPWATVATSYVRWFYVIDPWWVDGTWTFESVYGGVTYQHQFVIDNSTSLNENQNMFPCLLKPNPAKDQINVSIPYQRTILEVSVFDQLGKQLFVKYADDDAGNPNLNIDCSQYSSGIYFVKARSAEGIYISKFVKE